MEKQPDTGGGSGGNSGQCQSSHQRPAPNLPMRPSLLAALEGARRAQAPEDVHIQ
jgi:hypothetical protein